MIILDTNFYVFVAFEFIHIGRGCLETLYNTRENATLSSKTFGLTHLVRENNIGTCNRFMPLLLAAVNIASSIVCYRYVTVPLALLFTIFA